jgi:hypothetical protein
MNLLSTATESRFAHRQKGRLDRLCGKNGITGGITVLNLEIYGNLRQKNDRLRKALLNLQHRLV